MLPDSIVLRFNNSQYKWATKVYEQMRINFWIPQKVNYSQDVLDWVVLTEEEKLCFKRILAFLVFLDSLQTINLTYLAQYIKPPELRSCLVEQASQEILHSQSYQYLIDTVVPYEDRDEIYSLPDTDPILKRRCDFIKNIFSKFLKEPNEENFCLSLIGDYLLEGVFFYSGFNFFYTLSSRGLMGGTADTIKLIHRDELTHVTIFRKLIEIAGATNVLQDSVKDVLKQGFEQESDWASSVIGTGILGLSAVANRDFVKYLANKRAKELGLAPFYAATNNPYSHLDKIADLTDKATTKANFFESGVTSYTQAPSVSGWDF
jgi:ribonucleoside-diphosphate reductase beta chain